MNKWKKDYATKLKMTGVMNRKIPHNKKFEKGVYDTNI